MKKKRLLDPVNDNFTMSNTSRVDGQILLIDEVGTVDIDEFNDFFNEILNQDK